MNRSLSVDERLKAAKRLACRLVRYDGDYHQGRVGACDGYGEDLNGAIKGIIEVALQPLNPPPSQDRIP